MEKEAGGTGPTPRTFVVLGIKGKAPRFGPRGGGAGTQCKRRAGVPVESRGSPRPPRALSELRTFLVEQ